MDTFDNIDHIFKSILDILFQILLIRIESHMLLSKTNIKKTSFSLLFHLFQKNSH